MEKREKTDFSKWLEIIMTAVFGLFALFGITFTCHGCFDCTINNGTGETDTSETTSAVTTTTTEAEQTTMFEDYNLYENTRADVYDPERDYKVGDTFLFGGYEQDGNTNNGKEYIEWRVLGQRGGGWFVVSQYALDCVQYHRVRDYITWEESYLREWLNGDFADSAFSAEEQKYIVPQTIQNNDNPDYGTDGGDSTLDTVFCLSLSEAKEYFATSDSDRVCYPTDYAMQRGAGDYTTDAVWWWLRSPGIYGCRAARVYDYGTIVVEGSFVERDDVCVRPALVIGS